MAEDEENCADGFDPGLGFSGRVRQLFESGHVRKLVVPIHPTRFLFVCPAIHSESYARRQSDHRPSQLDGKCCLVRDCGVDLWNHHGQQPDPPIQPARQLHQPYRHCKSGIYRRLGKLHGSLRVVPSEWRNWKLGGCSAIGVGPSALESSEVVDQRERKQRETSRCFPSVQNQKNLCGRPSTLSATCVDGVGPLGVENSQPRTETRLFVVSPEKLSVPRPW